MGEWIYLTDEALRTRYAIAAYLLRDSSLIIEIGGYKTPIADFIGNVNQKVVMIDPLFELEPDRINQPNIQYICEDFDNVDASAFAKGKYDVVFLGIDIFSPDKDEIRNAETFSKFIHFVQNSRSTVLEYPLGFPRSKRQVDIIVSILEPTITFDCTLDFSWCLLEDGNTPDGLRGERLVRRMIKIERPKILNKQDIIEKVARYFYGSAAVGLAMHANRTREELQMIPFEKMRLHNGMTVNQSNGVLSFSTPAQRWAYAWDVALSIPKKMNDGTLTIEISASVSTGILAVGIFDENMPDEIITELFIRSERGVKKNIYISIPRDSSNLRLLARTGDDPNGASVEEFKATFCKFS